MTHPLARLRTEIAHRGLDGYIVPRSDEFQGEYVPPCSERLAWLTSFTGSAGTAIVLKEKAAVFSDGRYVTQMARQVDQELWSCEHMVALPPATWLGRNALPDARIGYDPKVMSISALDAFRATGLEFVATDINLVDLVWEDRPAPPAGPVIVHPLALAGASRQDKSRAIARILADAGDDAAVLADPASIAWLLNIRGTDVPYTPVVLAFALIDDKGTVDFFVAPSRLDDTVRTHLAGVRIHEPAELGRHLSLFAGRRVRIDPAATSVWFSQEVEAGGGTVDRAADPCALPKACKNDTEIEGARRAHNLDAVALCRFLHWLDKEGSGKVETALSTRLDAFRAMSDQYRGESFAAISGSGPNGAIIHYHAQPGQDRTLGQNEVYLIDSGAQYPCGTTDVTRAIWTGPDAAPQAIRNAFTRVLKGHMALSAARFPTGTTGHRLDALARISLWQGGLDYDHGTGHGVGSFLSVHEGPCNISSVARPTALEPGMILSNEPGYYETGSFGIRLENLILVRADGEGAAGRQFLSFEILTWAPFDRQLIDASLLSPAEITWLNSYHAQVLERVGPALDIHELQWLTSVCAPISAG